MVGVKCYFRISRDFEIRFYSVIQIYWNDKMNKFLLISISLLIFIIGVGCAAAADLDNGTNDSCGLGPNDHVFADESVAQLGPNDHVYAVEDESDRYLAKYQPQDPEPLAVSEVDDAVNVPVIGNASDDSLGKWFGPDKRIYASDDSLGKWFGPDKRIYASDDSLGMLGPHDHVFATAECLGMLGPHDHVFATADNIPIIGH